MRKIEQQMLHAVHAKAEKWINNNTAVFYVSADKSGNVAGSCSEVYLHGNLIAYYWHDVANPLDVNTSTLRQWSTPTTKSRLRALGANVSTRKGVTYLNNEPV